jgi:hypothetical protein
VKWDVNHCEQKKYREHRERVKGKNWYECGLQLELSLYQSFSYICNNTVSFISLCGKGK